MADPTINVKVETREAERSLDRLTQAFAALGAVVIGGSLLDFVDGVTNLQNKLRGVTNSTEEFTAAQRDVLKIARETSAPVKEVAAMFSRLSLVQDEVGLTGAGVAKVTELMTKQMKAAGVSGQEAASYILQMSQAFGAGKLSGDEFRSVMEANPAVMKLVAKEMGVTVGELKKLGSEGKITSGILRDVFLNNQQEIMDSYAKRVKTISDGFEDLKNAATELFIRFNDATGLTSALASALSFLAQNLDKAVVALTAFIIGLAVQKILDGAGAVSKLSSAFKVLNATLKANALALIITALATIGYMIYDDLIKPLKDAGVSAGLIAKYIAEKLINALIQVGDMAITVIGGIPDLLIAAFTPGVKFEDALKNLNKKIETALTTRRVKLLSDAELKQIDDIGKRGPRTTPTGPLTKPTPNVLTDAQKDALKALNDQIIKLEIAGRRDLERVMYSEKYAAIQASIAEEQAKLDKVNLKLSEKDKKRISDAITLSFYSKDMVKTQQTLMALADQITVLSEQDLNAREIKQGLLQYERSVSKEVYETNKGNVEQFLLMNQALRQQEQIRQTVKQLDNEIYLLGIQDLKTREVTNQILQQEMSLGRKLTDQERERLELKLKQTQALREQDNINRAIAEFQGRMTREQAVQRGIGIQGTVDPFGMAARDYATAQEGLKALYENGGLQAEQYEAQRVKLKQLYNIQVLELQNQEFDNYGKLQDLQIQRDAQIHAERLRQQKDFMGNQMFSNEQIKQIAQERAAFEKKTALERTQFGIQQGAELFGALGAQNKKAFEAAKAFNIANAIMNTYMGATKALATYPWPFGLIAAAAAVATGMAQVAAIRSQSYSGRALGGPVMGGQSYIVGESGPELFTPSTTGSITRNNQLGGQPVNVNFTIQANDAQGFDELLNQRRGMITQMISDAMLERGSRSTL